MTEQKDTGVEKRRTIAVYAEGPVALSSLVLCLKDTFNERSFDIQMVSAANIKTGILNKNVHSFFLPGIIGQRSPYVQTLGTDGAARIKDYVENGGVFVGLCAGAYATTTEFRFYSARQSEIWMGESPLNFFDGVSQGPLGPYVNVGDPQNKWRDHAIVRLVFSRVSAPEYYGAACYRLGPRLDLTEAALASGEYKVIARYDDVKDKPVAIASRNFGAGKAIFCGVHPEISGLHMNETLDPQDIKAEDKARFFRDMAEFTKRLSQFEGLRQRAWDRLVWEINHP